MIDEIEIRLSTEEERAANLKALLWMRRNDPWKTPKHVITNIMTELNVRIIQYVKQYQNNTLDFLIIQTLQDYRQHLSPCYETSDSGVLLRTHPVAILNDKREIFANPHIVKSDFSQAAILLFINDLSQADEPERSSEEEIEEEQGQAVIPDDSDIPF